jgi:hypothetical protein
LDDYPYYGSQQKNLTVTRQELFGENIASLV